MNRWWDPLDRRRRELDEELQLHLRMAAEDKIERGESMEQARRQAIREMGNVELIRDVTRETWGYVWLERIVQDAQYSLRQMRKSPGFAVVVTFTLALGFAAAAAMFTVVYRVLLRPLPYRDSHALVQILEAGSKHVSWGAPFVDLQEWRSRSHAFENIAFHTENGEGRPDFLEGSNGTSAVSAPAFSGNLLRTLGVSPSIGRGFAEDPRTGAVPADDQHTILLSDAVWRAMYGADPAILGRVVRLSGQPFTVIGVMPREFAFPYNVSKPMVWTGIVLADADKIRDRHNSPTYQVLGRLRAGASLQSAQREFAAIQADVSRSYTDHDEGEEVKFVQLQRYSDTLVDPDLEKSLFALLAASGVLWLIACVNVTGLTLARATARQREIATRGALGASRWRILQQLLVEGLIASAAAALGGIGLAVLIPKAFERALLVQYHLRVNLTPSWQVMGALLGLTVLSALISCLWPGILAARASVIPALRQGSAQAGNSRSQHRARLLLVMVEVAMSLTLMAACGLLLRTIYALRHTPLGFRTDHVLVANMNVPSYRYGDQDIQRALYQPLLQRVQSLPGVQSAALMTEVPLGKTFQMIFTFSLDGHKAADYRRHDMRAQFRAVSPDMQKVFGFRMLQGRYFDQRDTPTTTPVVVVNRAFVKAYEGEDNGDSTKILQETLMSFAEGRKAVVIGVLDDEHQVSVAEQSQPEIEVCLRQITPDSFLYKGAENKAMSLAVRTERDPTSVMRDVRAIMQSADSDLSTSNFTTMDQVVEDSFGTQQIAARLLELFGGAALLLCVSGIYGLLAFLVSQRTREVGIRVALGAQRAQVIWLVMKEAAWLLLGGIVAGVLLAYLSSRVLHTLLYGVSPHDPWTLAAVTVVLLVGGLTAAYFPARRAAAIDPMLALRTE